MQWIFEVDSEGKTILEDDQLITAVRAVGHKVELITRNDDKACNTHIPTIIRGSLGLACSNKSPVLLNYFPGMYCNFYNYRCSMYYNFFYKHILNQDFLFTTVGSLQEKTHIAGLKKLFGPKVFMKSDSGRRWLDGQVIDLDNGLPISLEGLKKDTLIMISSPKEIHGEFRFVVRKNNIVWGCQYKGEKDPYLSEVQKYVQFIIDDVDWIPENLWVIDAATIRNSGLCLDGEVKILELNSFSCSGLYDCDPADIVREASEQAVEDYKELFG